MLYEDRMMLVISVLVEKCAVGFLSRSSHEFELS